MQLAACTLGVRTNTRLQQVGAAGLSSVFVSEQVERSRAKRIVLMLDCCYSGAFARNTVVRAGGSVDVCHRALPGPRTRGHHCLECHGIRLPG